MTYEEQINYVKDLWIKNNYQKQGLELPSEAELYSLYGVYEGNGAKKISRKNAVKLVETYLEQSRNDHEYVTTKERNRAYRRNCPLWIRKEEDFSWDIYPMGYIGNKHCAYTFVNADNDVYTVYFCDNVLMHFLSNKKILTDENVRRCIVSTLAHERTHVRFNDVLNETDPKIAEPRAEEYATKALKKYHEEFYLQDFPNRTLAFIEFLKNI